jgi:naphthoate synthase
VPKELTPAFCAGGDQIVRSSDGGYDDRSEAVPRLRVLDLQIQNGKMPLYWRGHILHMCAHLTLVGEGVWTGWATDGECGCWVW